MSTSSSTPPNARLSDLTEILSGFAQRGPVPVGEGNLRMVMGRNLGESGRIDWNQLGSCERSAGSERARILTGDLLLTTRTLEPRVVLVTDPPQDVVAGAPFAILRLLPGASGRLTAAYLRWYLASDRVRTRLRSLVRGSSMPFLALAELGDLSIAIPATERQAAIVRADALRSRAIGLASRLDRAVASLLERAADL